MIDGMIDGNLKNTPQEDSSSANPALELGRKIFALLDEKKARDLLLLDLKDVNSYFQYFLLATATSPVHLKSLVRDIEKEFHEEMPSRGGRPRSEEADSGWVILDYIDLVIHIFLDEQRRFYNLERLWGDAKIEMGAPPPPEAPPLEDD